MWHFLAILASICRPPGAVILPSRLFRDRRWCITCQQVLTVPYPINFYHRDRVLSFQIQADRFHRLSPPRCFRFWFHTFLVSNILANLSRSCFARRQLCYICWFRPDLHEHLRNRLLHGLFHAWNRVPLPTNASLLEHQAKLQSS